MHQCTAEHSSFENLLGCLFTKFNVSLLFFNLGRYCFKHVVMHCRLCVRYLGSLAKPLSIPQAGKWESTEGHLGSSSGQLLFVLGILLTSFLPWVFLRLVCAERSLCSSTAWASKHIPYNPEQTCQLQIVVT